jgi:DNA-binding MarR family transcriptional regulator
LVHLRTCRDGARLRDIAAALAVTPASASDSVAALIEKGLVRRGKAAADGRGVLIRLTAKGRSEAERAAGWPDFLAEAAGELSAAEQGVFLRGLVKMIRRLQRQGRIPVARMCVDCRYFRPNAYAGSEEPHHCDFVNAPFGDRGLRIDCSDFQAGTTAEARAAWQLFTIQREER